MPPIKDLPNSHAVQWHSADAPDGTRLRSVRVSDPALQPALAPRRKPSSLGALAGLASLGRAREPHTVVHDDTLARMQRMEVMQQSVSRIVPLRSNNVPSIVASDGAAWIHWEMQASTCPPAPQYSKQAALETVQWATGVCDHVNNVLFRTYAANEAHALHLNMLDRATGRSALGKAMPVMFVQNADPHSFVLVGDPRDSRHAGNVIVGDSWEALPIVKTWSNTAYNQAPYTVKLQAVPGASAFTDLALDTLRASSHTAVTPSTVNDYLRGQGRPPLGPALLESLYENCGRHRAMLFDKVTSANQLAMIYGNPGGDRRHVPSIGLEDYQAYRLTLSKEAHYERFKSLV